MNDAEPPPPKRRAATPPPAGPATRDTTRNATRTAALGNCTPRCIGNCESEFEQCNDGASPAKASCVRQLEACRPARCGCRMW
jgi:hypothetical protein